MFINASIAFVFFVGSNKEGAQCATLVIQGIGKAGKQPFAHLVGRLQPEEGGALGLLKLQLQDLKKRRVLSRWEHGVSTSCLPLCPPLSEARERAASTGSKSG